LKPQATLTDTRWGGVTLHPARQAALREWFEAAGKRFSKGDQLLLFVTDHGTGDPKDPDNNAISLWQEKLTVRDLKALLARLPLGVQVVMVMSQCYSGAFANVVGDVSSERDVCGFFSTTGKQKAYGCYPEGRDRDQMGHAFHFIDALRRKATTAEAHVEVLADDDTPDAPLRTSDAYLARLVSAEAEARGTDADALVDSLLTQAWRTRAAWEPEIRVLDRIGTAFGTFSPRRGRDRLPLEGPADPRQADVHLCRPVESRAGSAPGVVAAGLPRRARGLGIEGRAERLAGSHGGGSRRAAR
jgi:peptidase C13-like protein